MVLTSGLAFALTLFKKNTLSFSVVDLATINVCYVVSNKYPSCSLVNFSNTYTIPIIVSSYSK